MENNKPRVKPPKSIFKNKVTQADSSPPFSSTATADRNASLAHHTDTSPQQQNSQFKFNLRNARPPNQHNGTNYADSGRGRHHRILQTSFNNSHSDSSSREQHSGDDSSSSSASSLYNKPPQNLSNNISPRLRTENKTHQVSTESSPEKAPTENKSAKVQYLRFPDTETDAPEKPKTKVRFSEGLPEKSEDSEPELRRAKSQIEWPTKNRPPISVTTSEIDFIPAGKPIRNLLRKVDPKKNESYGPPSRQFGGRGDYRGASSFQNRHTDNYGQGYNNNRGSRNNNWQNGRGYYRVSNNYSRETDRDKNKGTPKDEWEADEISHEEFEKVYLNKSSEGRQEIHSNSCQIDDSDWPDQPERKLIPKTEIKECDCFQCDFFMNCETWQKRHLQFDSSLTPDLKLPLLREEVGKSVQIHKLFPKDCLLHGADIPRKKKVNPFHEDVLSVLHEIASANGKNVQSYSWPAIFRGLSVFIVGLPKSGKTMAYLPVICSFALNSYSDLDEYKGPLILLLSPDTAKCKILEVAVKTLLRNAKNQPEVFILDSAKGPDEVNCDILITTPKLLISGLKANVFTLKRVNHLILEDGDVLLRSCPEEVKTVLSILDKIQLKRPTVRPIQTVVVSEKWSLDLEILLKNLYGSPLVCFSDYFEAAQYSKIEKIIKKVKPLYKIFTLEDILKARFATHKSIVFCDKEEVDLIKERLGLAGIENLALSEDLLETDEVAEYEDAWCYLKCGRYKTLICTDEMFSLAPRVVNADLIVHYSYPSDLETFLYRYRSLAANMYSPLEHAHGDQVFHVLIADEANQDHAVLREVFSALSRNVVANFKL